MPGVDREIQPSSGDAEAIRHLKQSIASGKEWYLALLEAIGLWSSLEETYNGRCYCYLIAGEAFDWLLLAERLCQEINGFIPEEEMLALLFFGKLPVELPNEHFKALIGSAKYRAYLNYLYGVVVEHSLLLAVEEEIHKERQALVFSRAGDGFEDSYQRIYGASELELLRRFRKEGGYPQRASTALPEMAEFTYWLFKYRLNNCDKARVASDTKKGLEYLNRRRLAAGLEEALPDRG